MSELIVRIEGRAGRITLNRPQALNALTYEMILGIEAAMDRWRDDPEVALVLIDGEGERAFCSGGDIAEMYASGQRGDLDYGRQFWRDEYRINAKIAEYPKPVVTLLHGFTMGGGVGVGCHASHRVVCESSRVAMPECSIGLIPDVGGSYLLAQAPGLVGTYLGLTGDRMDAGDAIYAGFADHFVPQARWDDLVTRLVETGDAAVVTDAAEPAPAPRLEAWRAEIDHLFAGDTLTEIATRLDASDSPAAEAALKAMPRNAPLAMGCALRTITAIRAEPQLRDAFDREFRYTYRAVEQGDFIEGIRAAIIDRDRTPAWAHADWRAVPEEDIIAMTAPLGAAALDWENET